MVGTTVSHYTILEKLGGGGMGVVYKARDLKLDRAVALKFLPPDLTCDPEAKQRFVHEAKAASALQHNNICTVHDIEETSDGQLFIVMDFYDGETLKSRIGRGPLKLSEAVGIVTQVASGLAIAHKQGLIHRDIKPANIMVTSQGEAKIVDFGLAKLTGRSILTRTGTTLGTAAYMSPEQVRGEPVDQRTDIWSLGVVLYEMVAGRLPFTGEYQQALAFQIMNDQPEPLTAIRTGVPIELDRIVLKMLAKIPDDRYQHVEEIPVDLRTVRAQSGSKPTMQLPTSLSARRTLSKWVWALGGVALGAAITVGALAVVGGFNVPATNQAESQHFSIILPDSTPLAPIGSAPLGIGQPTVAISPDGSLLAAVVQTRSGTCLQLRPLHEVEWTRLQGTEGAYYPFFSPNGRWLGFFSGNRLKKVPITGGSIATLCEASNPRGAVWAEDDRIYFSDREGSRLNWIQSNGGNPTEVVLPTSITGLTRYSAGFARYEYPDVLPDGSSFVYGSRSNLMTASLTDDAEKALNVPGSSPKYINSGHLAFYDDGSLLAAPFNVKRRELTGIPVPLVDGLLADVPHLAGHFSVSRRGTLVYVPGQTELDTRPVLVDRGGRTTVLPFPPGRYGTFQISPDGLRLVILSRVLGMDVWIFDLSRGSRIRMTTDGRSSYPIWSPDGKYILYNSGGRTSMQLVREMADGSGKREILLEGARASPYSFAPDGMHLGLTVWDSLGSNDISVIDLSGKSEPVWIARTSAGEWGPAFSNDGTYIAYVSDETGEYEVFVQPFPPDGRRWQVSTEEGEEPVWSGTGKELFYRHGKEWISVEVATTDGFTLGKRTVVLSGPYVNVGGRSYDVTRDGRRFLLLEPLGGDASLTEIRVITNWFREVEEKLRGR